MSKWTLEKTEWATKKGQSGETGNIVYIRHKTKTHTTKNTTQYGGKDEPNSFYP